ncbi:MAG: hypothetical protein AAF967_12995 [Pseudomonadota bacterium]
MLEFFFTASASFFGALSAIIVCYCGVLYSRGEKRRAISILVATVFSVAASAWFIHALTDGASAFVLVSAVFMASVGWFWLIGDVLGSMNRNQ